MLNPFIGFYELFDMVKHFFWSNSLARKTQIEFDKSMSEYLQAREQFESENGSELRDVSRVVCIELGYFMNRIKEKPCYEFISSPVHERSFSENSCIETISNNIGKRTGFTRVWATPIFYIFSHCSRSSFCSFCCYRINWCKRSHGGGQISHQVKGEIAAAFKKGRTVAQVVEDFGMKPEAEP